MESRGRVRGWETNKLWFVFRKLLGWIFQSSSYFFQDAFFFEVPHSGYPSALLSAQALASPPARGRSRGVAAVTVLLDKLYRNLHKPQGSRCTGRLEGTCFSVGFSLTSAANHS